MKSTVLAKRYAKALFTVGKEDDAVEQYGRDLTGMAEAFQGVSELADVLVNPLYPEDVRLKVMEQIGAAMKIAPVMVKFFGLLIRNKRAAILPDLAESYQMLVDQDKNLVRGSVLSATELSGGLLDKIKATLEKITGKQVELTTRIEPAIIGGMVAKVGDLVLDASLRSQLAGLKESIVNS